MDLARTHSPRKKRQQRIERYFRPSEFSHLRSLLGSETKDTISFLDLPVSVRKRIYSAAGLIASPRQEWGCITMNRGSIIEQGCHFEAESNAPPGCCPWCFRYRCWPNTPLWMDYCNCDPFPFALFRVCRTISNEVTHLFYSQMRFEIAYTSPGKLSALEGLGPNAIASLRHLTIRLNVSFCPKGPTCRNAQHASDCHPGCRLGGHDAPLGWFPKSRNDKVLLLSFSRLCDRLRHYIQPGRLKLTLSCESTDHVLAATVLASLATLPTLRACSILLSKEFDACLRQMAEETRLRLLGYPESRVTGYFPLRNLPRELELRVLRLTDLVAPSHLWYAPVKYPKYWSPWGRQRCKYSDLSTAKLANLEELPDVCCKCSAHSFATAPCAHWHFPDALFLVDRRMAEDARMILHRDNTWMLPWEILTGTQPVLPLHLGSMWHFIRNVRNLTIDLSYFPDNWHANVDKLVSECAVELLRLVIQLPHPNHEGVNLSAGPASPVWAIHCEVIRSLAAALAGRKFRDFFVTIRRHHMGFDDIVGDTYVTDCPSLGEHVDAMELWLERQVMEREHDIHRRTRDLEARVCPGGNYIYELGCSQCEMLVDKPHCS